MWAEHGQCGVNRTRMRKHFVWKNATQSSSPVVCFTLFPHKNGKILKRRCASHCHARVVGASDALLLFIHGPRVVKIEVENAMKCKVFSHAHLVDWSESSYFLFCFVLVFIGTISLTYFFFLFRFSNSRIFFATPPKATYRPQLTPHGCKEPVKEITQHTHIRISRQNTILFFLLRWSPSIRFFPLNSWMCSHLCRPHGYRSPVADKKKHKNSTRTVAWLQTLVRETGNAKQKKKLCKFTWCEL